MRNRLFLLIMSAFFLSGCGIEASLVDINVAPEIIPQKPRTFPDAIAGEVVVSSTGHEIRAVIGEMVEKTSSNGYEIEAVFSETIQ